MTVRSLPASEWPRLSETEAKDIWQKLDPLMAKVIVVEEDDQIIASHVLLPVWHLECLWVHPDHRKRAGVLRRLWRGMLATMQSMEISAVATAACSDDVRRLLGHVHALPLVGDHFLIRL